MGVGGREGRVGGQGRGEEKKNMVARSLAEENAMQDTWLAQGAATSVLDEDPGARLCVHVWVHVCGRKRRRCAAGSLLGPRPLTGVRSAASFVLRGMLQARRGCGKQAGEKPQAPPDPFESFSCQVLITGLT